ISDDGNGDFGVSSISINVPPTAVQNQSIGVRFRLSHDDNMTPYGIITSGEVEDYLIQVECPPQHCSPIQITVVKGGNP
ncbi:MAG: GEVED domain-containing protein, partial [Saprospiraceae bacterium]